MAIFRRYVDLHISVAQVTRIFVLFVGILFGLSPIVSSATVYTKAAGNPVGRHCDTTLDFGNISSCLRENYDGYPTRGDWVDAACSSYTPHVSVIDHACHEFVDGNLRRHNVFSCAADATQRPWKVRINADNTATCVYDDDPPPPPDECNHGGQHPYLYENFSISQNQSWLDSVGGSYCGYPDCLYEVTNIDVANDRFDVMGTTEICDNPESGPGGGDGGDGGDSGDGGDGGYPGDGGDGGDPGDGGDGGDPGDGGDGGDPGDGGDGDGGIPGDGDGDGDGDGSGPGGGGGDGDGDGDCEGDDCGEGGYGGGTCSDDGRTLPECTSDLDPIQCAIYLETWERRCDAKLWHDELKGDPEYSEGPSLLDAEGEGNEIHEEEVSFNQVLDELDDSGSGFGGSSSCPADRDVSLGPLGTISIPMTFLCDWADRMRPFVIALGWLSAGLIIVGRMSGGK